MPVPEDTWMLSVTSTGLLVMAINITIAVELYKKLLDVILMFKVCRSIFPILLPSQVMKNIGTCVFCFNVLFVVLACH